MTKIYLKDWDNYLFSRINIDLYVYSGNGELFVNQLPRLTSMELINHTQKQAFDNTQRVLTLLHKRLLQGVNIFDIRGEDCGGLAVKFLLDNGIIDEDMTANALYHFTKKNGKEIPLSEVRNGDYVFEGDADNKWHVGYAVSETSAVECMNHDEGVVETTIAKRKWKYATRPNWYIIEPKKPILTRELKLTDPYMRGEDVREAQLLLQAHGYNPGTIDGVFGKNTEIASKNFKHDNGLKSETGTIGKKTAEKLGFIWEGK